MKIRVKWADTGQEEEYLHGTLIIRVEDGTFFFHDVPDGGLLGVVEPGEWETILLEAEDDD